MSDKPKLPPDDAALFREAVKGVRQYKPVDRSHIDTPNGKLQNHSHFAATDDGDNQTADILSNELYHDAVTGSDQLLFVRDGIQQSQLRRLRQGEVPPSATLDLHGYNSEQARIALGQFLETNSDQRCVMVIHGKGYTSKQQHPILKNLVNGWLRQHPAVLAFCSAQAEDGGSGAVYILLKRSR